MYFSHAFRKTLLGVDAGSGVLSIGTSAIGSATYSSVGYSTTAGATYTMSGAHGFVAGDVVLVSGFTGSAVVHNGYWIISSVPTTSTFVVPDYSNVTTAGSPEIGRAHV